MEQADWLLFCDSLVAGPPSVYCVLGLALVCRSLKVMIYWPSCTTGAVNPNMLRPDLAGQNIYYPVAIPRLARTIAFTMAADQSFQAAVPYSLRMQGYHAYILPLVNKHTDMFHEYPAITQALLQPRFNSIDKLMATPICVQALYNYAFDTYWPAADTAIAATEAWQAVVCEEAASVSLVANMKEANQILLDEVFMQLEWAAQYLCERFATGDMDVQHHPADPAKPLPRRPLAKIATEAQRRERKVSKRNKQTFYVFTSKFVCVWG